MQAPDPDRRVALLEKAAKQFPGTHYGVLADKAAAAARQYGGRARRRSAARGTPWPLGHARNRT